MQLKCLYFFDDILFDKFFKELIFQIHFKYKVLLVSHLRMNPAREKEERYDIVNLHKIIKELRRYRVGS